MGILNLSKKAVAGRPIPSKPVTERRFTRAGDVVEFLSVVEGHRDRIAYEYFISNTETATVTYTEYAAMVRRFAAGLTELGLGGKTIALIGETLPRWTATYLAVLATGGVIVPMDKELAPAEISSFLEIVKADAVVGAPSMNEVLAEVVAEHPTVTRYITMGDAKTSEEILLWSEVEEQGEKAVADGYAYPAVADRTKLAEYLFTSGTTGTSKCVMLSQKNIFSVVNSASETVDFNPEDVLVSVLPMHHTYGLACMLAELLYGVRICINDSLRHTLRNFARFRPTGLVLVPLFVQTMYKKILAEAERKGKARMLSFGVTASRALRRIGVDLREKLFADVREAFGGRLSKIICGGAPLNPELIYAFEDFGISIYEGFGITECAPLVSVTPYFKRKSGSVGPAVPCCTVRIDGETINDFGFAEGEIQVNGDNVMLGYFNHPEANAAAFTEDGWFRTGDVGYMDADGYIYITGRMKSVIVLENGKNVFPEEIEEYLSDIPLIGECVVVGRRNEEDETVTLTAVVYPSPDAFSADATEEEKLASIRKAVRAMNKKIPSFKQVKEIELRDQEFPKTTSRKIKRHLIK